MAFDRVATAGTESMSTVYVRSIRYLGMRPVYCCRPWIGSWGGARPRARPDEDLRLCPGARRRNIRDRRGGHGPPRLERRGQDDVVEGLPWPAEAGRGLRRGARRRPVRPARVPHAHRVRARARLPPAHGIRGRVPRLHGRGQRTPADGGPAARLGHPPSRRAVRRALPRDRDVLDGDEAAGEAGSGARPRSRSSRSSTSRPPGSTRSAGGTCSS